MPRLRPCFGFISGTALRYGHSVLVTLRDGLFSCASFYKVLFSQNELSEMAQPEPPVLAQDGLPARLTGR